MSTRPVLFTQQLAGREPLTAQFTAELPDAGDPGRVLHGSEIHPGNVGIVGAGVDAADLAPVGDPILTEDWCKANRAEDVVWHGACEAKPDVDHWHLQQFRASRVRVAVDHAHVGWGLLDGAAPYPLSFFGTTAFNADHVGLIAEWLEVAGPSSSRTYGIVLQGRRPGSALVRRVHVHGHAIGASMRRGNRFENVLVSNIRYYRGSHNTCMSTTGGSASQGVAVSGCKLLGGNSAAMSLYTDQGPNVDVQVRDCYLAPDRANYALYAGEDPTNGDNHSGNRDLGFTGNVFGRDFQRFSGSSAPVTQWNGSRPGALWEGNRWGPRGPHWQPGDPEEGDPVTG